MKVLVVDDEVRILEFMKAGLAESGYEVEMALSAEEAMELIKTKQYDAFVVDIMLPGQSGVSFCRWLREIGHREPIMMLTAKTSLNDKVEGLDAGADDYLTKPFEVAELQARLRAMLRKTQGYPKPDLAAADLKLDPNTRIVKRGAKEIALSKKESVLLEYLLKNKNKIVTRAMISNVVWQNDGNLYTNVIDVFINHIRKKVDGEFSHKLIQTVRGKGFMISDLPNEEPV